MSRHRTRARRAAWLAASVAALACSSATSGAPREESHAAPTVPERLDDSTFWRMMTEYSEPWGVFRSENLVSNETSLQWPIPELRRRVAPGGVYVGVAPDQNFTYIAALRPAIAFIVDIRHQNAMQHLMYKALLETSRNRAEFLAALFSRAPLAGVDSSSTAEQLFTALERQPRDSARYRTNLHAMLDRLTRVHRFALSDSERVSLGCVYGAFYAEGPDLTYSYTTECRNPGAHGNRFGGVGGGFGRGGFRMPTYRTMLTGADSAGTNWSYLGSERAFRAVKAMEERNLIVPLTGDFAGETALRSIGAWARAHDATVTTFYVSNVEQYLFQQDDDARRFYANVLAMPIDSTSMFVRSFAGGRWVSDSTLAQRTQRPGRSLQLVSPMMKTLHLFQSGELASWGQVLGASH
jgi:hypothetical protein